ncbi:Protein CBG09648 [Caenorhabditis briggsae]|uniref:Protein CBG09648 n=1 Tax=Caenorhabditis briggsae TaxID=6238 RepID=A8X8K2_CAEBR|nr:Protein CBG09648 [Caenorhabditis briggsae]CAP28963.2 Protein CBG09648 [Caenorhabditis briggsae]
MLILLLLIFISAPLCRYILYPVVYAFLKWRRPVRKFTAPTAKIRDILNPDKDEWNMEEIKNEEIITISGSGEDDSFVYIQIITKNGIHSSHIRIFENGTLYSGSFDAYFAENRTIICGPLIIELRNPFRKWRINFRGYLKDNDGNSHFIILSGWWRCVTNARFFYSNAPLKSFTDVYHEKPLELAENLKTIEKYRTGNVFHQMGEYHAEIKIGNGEVVEHRYRGLRHRNPLNLETTSTQFHTYLSDGNAISHRVNSLEHQKLVSHAIIFRADHSVRAVTLHNSHSLESDNMMPVRFNYSSGKFLPFEMRKGQKLSHFNYIREDRKVVDVTALKVNSAIFTGIGFVVRIREALHTTPAKTLDCFPEYHATDSEKVRQVLPFGHRACQDKLLTGGKGANLARLQAITNDFHVPPGIVVTTAAFNEHVRMNRNIAEAIKLLDQNDQSANYYEETGKRIGELLIESEVSEELHNKIREWLPFSEYYAVRSSAVGEDGADLSSAGQLESYLDVFSHEISDKLKLCWASNFRREVLNYRKNYGQQLNPSMAVVIQEMNRNGVAGVMFTANPVKLDCGEIVINALKGSGEQIVSGVTTPDEIHVNRINKSVVINKIGTECCLNDFQIEKLSRVGEYLERIFGKPQDIEFVVRGDQVNIVQSRDITGLDKETSFEMYTEYNSPSIHDKEILTNANVGEVLPAPVNAMEAHNLTGMFDKVICVSLDQCMTTQEINDVVPAHTTIGFSVAHRKIFFNLGEVVLRIWEMVEKDRITDIVIAGETLFSPEMFRQAAHQYGSVPSFFPLKRMYRMIKLIYFTSNSVKAKIAEIDKEAKLLVPTEDMSVEEVFKKYEELEKLWCDAIRCHTDLSMFSSFTYVLCGMLIRGSDTGPLSNDNISDFANVFSNNSRGDVVSADVPNSLKKLAKTIREDGLVKEFCDAEGNDSLKILENGRRSSQELQRFFDLHGHRGPKELYLDAATWEEDTDLLVHTIKSMLSFPEASDKTIENEDDIIDKLKCKPTGIRRRFLKYFIGQTHRGVAFRETAKNHLVSTTNSVRKTCRMIGKKLYQKGYLPDPNLWMHFSIDELKELNETRSAKLISRAVRRKQIASKFEGLQFPLVAHGYMSPIKVEIAETDASVGLTLRGTTVCEGKVRANARVAKTLEEAKETIPGEILITRYTDICWSPFFPMISGIVTEIGGLLSHGAVVAREYGLPSLIAVTNATQHFKTGDFVELDSINGTIIRLDQNHND